MQTGLQIAMAQPFLDSLDALDKPVRKAVRETIGKVQAGNPSVHVHKLEGLPFVAFDVLHNAFRVVCKREDDTLLLCHAGTHKEAYDWAGRNRAVQVGKHLRIIRTEIVTEEKRDETSGVVAVGPLAAVTDAVFARIDVAARTAAVLRSVPDDDTLLELATHLPPARGEALLSLVGDGDADAIEVDYRKALAAATTPTLAQAVAAETNAGHVWLTSPDDESVKAALEGGIAAWRVFLHPSQRRLVRIDANGALKIGGGPGTGKTVVTLHRARWLAEHVFADDARPVLVTTFNSTLARQLEPMLDELCTGAPAVRGRIVVRSTTRVAQEILKERKRPNKLVTDLDDAWKTALEHDEAGRGRRFYESERAHVLARHGAWTEAEYLAATRTGRTNRLDRAARKAVWKVLAAFEAALEKAGGGDDVALARNAELAVLGEKLAPFAAIVCDEAQDLGAADLRLLAALARDHERGNIRANALTLAGDAYQRLYRAPVPLSACGIDVRGRARNLRLNYRTTEAIRRAAVAVVSGSVPDEADATDSSTLEGYRALRRGAPPEERTFASAADEAAWIVELAKDARGTLLVLARTNDYLDALKALLVARGATPRVLGANDLPSDADTLVLCTLHRAKGLEAPRVVVAGRHLVPLRYPGGGDPADRAEWDKKESAALYVGITRARDWCGISRVGVS